VSLCFHNSPATITGAPGGYSSVPHNFRIDLQAAQRNGSAAAAGLARHHNYYCTFWQIAPARSGRAAVRLEPVLGVFLLRETR